jgi:hypothetical protein
LTTLKQPYKNKRENLTFVSQMMKKKNVNGELSTRVRKYLEFVWRQEEEEDTERENAIINKLSNKLRDEMFLDTNVKFLKMIPALSNNFKDTTLIKIARIMKKVRFSPEEFVYHVKIKLKYIFILYL